MEEIGNTGPFPNETFQKRRDFLDQKEKELMKAIENGKQKEKEIREHLKKIQEKLQKMLVSKKIPERKKIELTRLIATVSLLIMLLMSKQTGEMKQYTQDKNIKKKEIILPEKMGNVPQKDTAVISEETKEPVIEKLAKKNTSSEFTMTIKKGPQPQKPAKQQETKEPVIEKLAKKNTSSEFTMTIKKGPQPQKTTTSQEINIYTGKDDVFAVIETIQLDPRDNSNINDRYTHWKSLSVAEKNTVKSIYKTVIELNDVAKIKTIINGLDKPILLGLYDICVKKLFMLKNAGKTHELEKMRIITQIIVYRQDELFRASVTDQIVEKHREE